MLISLTMVQNLRTEIIESEKSRIDLLKWKFIVIAALGSIALGVGIKNSSQIPQEATLCLIPLVCVYVDLLCKHLNLRILVISRFIRTYSLPKEEEEKEIVFYQEYENFCADLRRGSNQNIINKFIKFIKGFCQLIKDFFCSKNGSTNKTFELEDFAQEWSTIIIILLVIVIGVTQDGIGIRSSIIISCIVSFLLTFVTLVNYTNNIHQLENNIPRLQSDSAEAIKATLRNIHERINRFPDDERLKIRNVNALVQAINSCLENGEQG